MASAVSSQHIRSNYLFQVWDHDPGGTTATVVTDGTTSRYVDGKDLTHFGVIAIQTVIGSSSGITWLMEECSMAEVAHLSAAAGLNLRYMAGRLTSSNAGDEAVVVYFGVPTRAYKDRTPATTIS
jgi:hypothetical protein